MKEESQPAASYNALEAALQGALESKQRGEYQTALTSLQVALQRRFSFMLSRADSQPTDAQPLPLDLLALEALADLAVLFHQTDAADDLLEGIGLWYARAGNRYFAEYIAIKRLHLALGDGRLSEAYEQLRAMSGSLGDPDEIDFSEAGLKTWEAQLNWPWMEPVDYLILLSRLYLGLGMLLAGFGQYREAVAALKRGLQHTATGVPALFRDITLHLKLACAAALLEQGYLQEARIALDELEAPLSDRRLPGLYLQQLELTGKLGLLTGAFGPALECFRQVLETSLAFGLTRAGLTASLNLAHVLIYLNQTSAARDILLATQAQAEALNDQANIIRAGFLRQVAQARGHSLAGAVPIAPSVSEAWGVVNDAVPESQAGELVDPFALPQSDNYLAFFEDRALGFHWLLGRRDFAGAEAYLDELKQVFAASDSILIQMRLHLMTGVLAYYQGDWHQAALLFQEVQSGLRQHGLKPELWQLQRFLGWCWTRLDGHEGKARQTLEEETQQLLDELTDSLAPSDRALFLINKWTEDEEYLANEIHRLAVGKAKLEAGSWLLRAGRRWQLMRRLHRLSLHIDRHKDVLARRSLNEEQAETPRATPMSLLRRLLTHPRDRATLSFLVLPDQVFILRAGWLTLDFGVSPVTRLQVRDLVRRWHELTKKLLASGRGLGALPDEHPNEHRQGLQVANYLAEALQVPAFLDTLSATVRALTIVPDDSLHGFPFAAIVHQGRYLIERYALSLAFESCQQSRSASSPALTDALAVAVSRGSHTGFPPLMEHIPPLPGALSEIEQITAWFDRQGCRVYRFDDAGPPSEPAQKAVLLKQLTRVEIFHIACHGIFKADAPDQSGLVLIPRPEQPEILSLRELAALKLEKLQHVTLSSCWSADHFILPGRWVISLPETLWRAGAQSILGCLWVVNDELSIALMRCFYHYLEKHPRDEALRLTQLDCLHNRLPGCRLAEQATPYYWAGYNLYGAPYRLEWSAQ